MPIYEYRCKKGHTLEVMHRMSDDPLASCTTCGAPVQRVFHPVAVHFKGSGFYNTDYGKQSKGADDAKAKSAADGKSKDSSDSSSEAAKSSSDSSNSGGEKSKSKASSESRSSS